MIEITATWKGRTVCPHCQAWLRLRAEDLYGRDGALLLICPNCEREFDYEQPCSFAVPPFQREQALMRTEPGRLPKDA